MELPVVTERMPKAQFDLIAPLINFNLSGKWIIGGLGAPHPEEGLRVGRGLHGGSRSPEQDRRRDECALSGQDGGSKRR